MTNTTTDADTVEFRTDRQHTSPTSSPTDPTVDQLPRAISLDACPAFDGSGSFSGSVDSSPGPFGIPNDNSTVGIYGLPDDDGESLEFIAWASVSDGATFECDGNGKMYAAFVATLVTDHVLTSIGDLVDSADENWDSPLSATSFRSPDIQDADKQSLLAAVEQYFDTNNETGMMMLEVSSDPDAPPPVDTMIAGLVASGAPTGLFTAAVKDQMTTALDEVWEDYRQLAATSGAETILMSDLRDLDPVEFASLSCLACKVQFSVLLGLAAAALLAGLMCALIASGGAVAPALLGLPEGLVEVFGITSAEALTVTSGIAVSGQLAWIGGVVSVGAVAALIATIPRRICQALNECGTSDNEFAVVAGSGVSSVQLVMPTAAEHEVADARNWQGARQKDDQTIVVAVDRDLQESVATSYLSKVDAADQHLVYCSGGNGIASKVSFWVKCQLIVTLTDGQPSNPIDIYLSQGERKHRAKVHHFWQLLSAAVASNDDNNGGTLDVAGTTVTVSQTGSAYRLEFSVEA